ncbi:sulfurtransferase complex subunit TusB [Rhodoferax sp. 4810]|uniref:Sulfurtransferase complex subunit TusB n=1 Tax=Thiospirillum jenense TaxID=1653858 RepID=A0A839HEZ2_9GAMM|nr:sulfurtransferase complex subunit TusB [Thiospirillum jenense]MBB1073395.1 sulfurtransferase complex subunit TusB [Rhodoferax jenense]MBB1125747.1 sulfurtransferase complex subunit TusB [Thiospirillum jenense]
MSILHTVNKSPFEKTALAACLNHITPDATILLFEDGVYGALQGSQIAAHMQQTLTTNKIYVLGADLKARGFDTDRLIPGMAVVEYDGFVELVAQHDKVQAWL